MNTHVLIHSLSIDLCYILQNRPRSAWKISSFLGRENRRKQNIWEQLRSRRTESQSFSIVLDDIFPMISDPVFMYENLTFSWVGISVWSPVFIVNGTSYDNGNWELNRKVIIFTWTNASSLEIIFMSRNLYL